MRTKMRFPDKSFREIGEQELKAIKKKSRKENITPEKFVKMAKDITVALHEKNKTMDKFGETKLDKGTTMAESCNDIMYHYLRFTYMEEAGKDLGVKVISVSDLLKEVEDEKK